MATTKASIDEKGDARSAQTAAAAGSELDQAIWAVISSRGVEAANLTHGEATQTVAMLFEKAVSGLVVLPNAAARRINRG